MTEEKLIEFWKFLGNLKQIPRTGWLMRGINLPETIAAHNWRVSVIAYKLTEFFPEIDREKIFLMSLYHELGETRLGDVPTPMGKYFPKDEVEWQVCQDLAQQFSLSQKELSVLEEYFNEDTLEKRIVVAADKIDMFLQASFYFDSGYKKVEDFFLKLDNYINKFKDLEPIKKIFEELKREYEQKKRS